MNSDGQKPTARSPGDLVRTELAARGWTQEDLAKVLERPQSRISELVKGKLAISTDLALALAAAFGTSPEYWLNAETTYRLSLASTDSSDNISRRAKVYTSAPVKELQRRGWIRTTDSVAEIESDLKVLFDVNDLDVEPNFQGAMRKSQPNLALTPTQRAWVSRVRQLSSKMIVGKFDESKLRDCRKELRGLAAYSAHVGKVSALLAKHGIRFVVVEPLSGCKVDGVALWLDQDSPVIGLSLRFDRIDSFWFTLGHEVSHIANRDDAPLDAEILSHDEPGFEVKSPIERRADEESSQTFIPKDELESFIKRVGPMYSKERINQFANRIKVHPGIIVGQLHHRGEMRFSANREMLVKVRHIVTPASLTDGWGHSIDLRKLA